MGTNLVEKIAKKASSLSVESQLKVLAYIESLEREGRAEKKPFRSVLGILTDRDVQVSEEDIAEMRRDAWRNFPREEPN